MVCSQKLNVRNCATTLEPPGIYPALLRPEEIGPAQKDGAPSNKQKITAHTIYEEGPSMNVFLAQDLFQFNLSIAQTQNGKKVHT